MNCTKCGKEIDNDSKFCDGCGETIVAETQAAPKKKLSKKLIAIIAVVVAAVILVVALASGGESSSLTVPYENDAGAVLNMNLNEFNTKLNENFSTIESNLGIESSTFDISQHWSNMVEPMKGAEEKSGAAFTTYSAFVDNICISVSVQGENISTAQVSFVYDDNNLDYYLGAAIFMACSNIEMDDATKVLDTIIEETMSKSVNSMIYKDGLLYSLMPIGDSSLTWHVSAASEEFVQSLEDSGSCNVLRW